MYINYPIIERLHCILNDILQVTPTSDDQLEQAMDSVGVPERRSACKQFLQSLQALETQLQGVKEQVSVLQAPQLPDLEKVHISIDQCQVSCVTGCHCLTHTQRGPKGCYVISTGLYLPRSKFGFSSM